MKQNRTSSTVCWAILICICIASAAFMLYASWHESPIVDEDAHIPAGYGYVHELDYRLNPEHPPLVKALAAAPLLALQPHFPTDNLAWTMDVNGQWDMGYFFLYGSGNNPDTIVRVARLGPIFLTLLLIIFIYYWSKKLMGEAWALLPAFLFAFSPTVLAHGHYVTTDIGAAFGVLFSTYFFLKSLRAPSWSNLLMAGAALGIAQLMKFSAVLIFPYFGILAFVHLLIETRDVSGKYFWRRVLRRAAELALVGIVGFMVIYAVYFVFTLNYPMAKQVSDTQSILNSLISTTPSLAGHCGPLRCLANLDIWMAGHAATRPMAEYFLGVLMVIQRAGGGNTSYFLGTVTALGSHLYFPIIYALKESLPALGILLVALLITLWRIGSHIAHRRSKAAFGMYLRENFTTFAFILFLFIYWGYSIKSNLNIGVRHLMPVIPIMYILAAGFWHKWIMGFNLNLNSGTLRAVWSVARSVLASSAKLALLIFFVGWVILETFIAAPHFLSYFNELGGGTMNGYRYVTDSNYDWGQDMLRLRDFVNAHPEIDKIAVDYFGAGSPSYYLGTREVNWQSYKGNPADQGIHWFAVSINLLQNGTEKAAPDFHRAPDEAYPWLVNSPTHPTPPGLGQVPKPDFRVGTAIFVYHL